MVVNDLSYDQHGEATLLLHRMRTRGVQPDVMTYTALISGSKRTADCVQAESIFEEMLTYGVKPNCRTCTAMLRVRFVLSSAVRLDAGRLSRSAVLYGCVVRCYGS